MRHATFVGVLVLAAAPLRAQSEAALKERFEGRTVTVKLAMPGTEDGVDIYPGTARPLDYSKYAGRLKQYGTALRKGQEAMVTKVKVKGKLIEFQLDGGGYGTMGDETSTSVSVPSAEKTRREKDLEAELKRTDDPARKREIREELDDLKAEREREDARNRAAVSQAEEQKRANLRQRRLEGGSRFNVRYRDRVPAEALTPAGLMRALADYVDFGDLGRGPVASSDSARSRADSTAGTLVLTPAPVGPDRRALPKRGMTLAEADALLGRPASESSRREGRLTVVTRVYPRDEGKVTAEFVEGILFRYRLTSD